MDESIYNLLKNLTSNSIQEITDKRQLKTAIYMTLLVINNNQYTNEDYLKEQEEIENFLRKINNLKIKIQLKRKETEIEELQKEILTIYHEQSTLINKYNIDNLDIPEILNTKNAKEITLLIDKLTKIKMKKHNKKQELADIKEKIVANLENLKYTIKENSIKIITKLENIEINFDDFYEVFEYLLNEKNYHKTKNKDLIQSLINKINYNSEEFTEQELISIILIHFYQSDKSQNTELDYSNIKIENIKITDLYSFAKETNINKQSAKWNKILIPNNYLTPKIKELIAHGMFYYKGDRLVLEGNKNTSNDFKISIDLKTLLNILKNQFISNENITT